MLLSLFKEPPMAGETVLATLLRSMSPHLNAGEYVFCTLRDHRLPEGWRSSAVFANKKG